MSTVPVPSEQRLVVGGVTWDKYLRLLRIFDDRHLRITYDRGEVEIMTISPEHERFKKLLGYLIVVLVEELGWNIASFGSMTFKRRTRKRGLEPDECYWIQSEPLVRGKDRIDLRRDPPPDLVVEVEVTHNVLDRLSIFAALYVAEVWRYDGQRIRALHLGANNHYAEQPHSRAFPFLAVRELESFLAMRGTHGETDLLRLFRAWVRQRIAAGWA